MRGPRGGHQAESVAPSGAVRACRLERAEPAGMLRAADAPRVAWADEATTLVAAGAATRVTASGAAQFDAVRERGAAVFAGLDAPPDLPTAARPRLVGGFAFHQTHDDPGEGTTWHGYPGASFVLPAVQVVRTDEETWLTAAATGEDAAATATDRLGRWRSRLAAVPAVTPGATPGVSSRRRTPGREGWREQVRAATDSVAAGRLRKVVLAQAQELALASAADPVDVLARLSATYPDCFRFLIDPPGGSTFVGATPERLVTVDGRAVRTEALAGSTGRGDTPDEDEWLATELRESEKDTHEHELVADAVCDQLAGLSGSVRTGERTVRRLATVQHLRTPVRATLDRDEHVLDIVEALHPTPAVGGLPPDRALGTIRETETFDRGWYAAPVGWFDAAGDGSFAVAIRSALLDDRRATLFAGAGIVADSDPENEWDELGLKYQPLLDALE